MEKHRFLESHGLTVKKVFSTLLICVGLLLSVQGLYAQNKKINVKGTVKDASGEVVIGASVLEKGTTNGVITDLDGNFILSVSPKGTLVFSYVGYATQEIPVNGKSSFQIVMNEDSKVLNEVVVVGYGTMRKKDLTGSIVQIRPDKLANEKPKTVQDVLRGTPGLNIGYDDSAKGGGSMQIRGQRSVYTDGGHNDPLIILDGMMFYGELSEINPEDIGQIDILKDASAASVYGAKSANGVIIITTKKGKKGKPQINFSASVGFATLNYKRKVFGPEGYLQYRRDWYKTQTYGVNADTGAYEAYQATDKKGMYGYYDQPTADNLNKYGITMDQWKAYDPNMAAGTSDNEIWGRRIGMYSNTLDNYLSGYSFDWYDHAFRTGINQDYNVSISGASDRMSYYLSLGYLSNEGVIKGQDYTAVRANMKVEGKVTDWLTVSANVNFQDRSDGDQAVDWRKQITENSPFATYADASGNPVIHPMGEEDSKGYNYDYDRQYRDLEKGYTVLNSIFSAKVSLPFNITYTFNAAPRYQWFYDRWFESSEHPDWSALDHGVNREQSKRFDWSLNNTINWDYTFADKHHVNVTLVQEAEERKFWQDKIQARNLLPTDALGFHETKVGDKDRSTFDSNDTHETADGMLARLFYSYDERYMFTGAVRRDGYSAFGISNPRATFASVALAWTFTNESFFKWKPMSMGKLRFSWGSNGNRSLGDPYIALADMGMGMGATQGYVNAADGSYVQYRYMSVGRLANPNLRWEKTTSWNVGLDFGFLDNRITGTFDYYVMPTSDMIMKQRLPIFSGVDNITTNLGKVENKGFELSINSQNIRTRNFEWNTTLGFSKYKNTIKHLYYEMEDVKDVAGNVIGQKEKDDTGNKWFIGQPIGVIWDYRVTGIWQADEAEEADKYGQRPGDPKVANNYTADDDVNADGTVKPKYNDKDKEFLGQSNPKSRWSLRNEFTIFKNLNFSFNIYSCWGHKRLDSSYMNQDNGSSLITKCGNLYAKEYWTLENQTNEYARLDAKGPANGGPSAPGKLYDMSFIRLDNISIGYTLPKSLTSKWKMDKVKVYGTIRNVAVWTKEWKLGDPEYFTDNKTAPTSRTYTLGLNITL